MPFSRSIAIFLYLSSIANLEANLLSWVGILKEKRKLKLPSDMYSLMYSVVNTGELPPPDL